MSRFRSASSVLGEVEQKSSVPRHNFVKKPGDSESNGDTRYEADDGANGEARSEGHG